MQACLARLYVDEPFRKLFYLDPAAVLEGYRLTEEESAALRRLDPVMLDQFASSLVAKRRKRIERAYPLLFGIDGPEIRRYYARFYGLYPTPPYQVGHQDIIEFGTFLEASLVGTSHLPPYASDLAKYERLYFWARMASAPGGEEDRDRAQETPAAIVSPDARPVLRPDVTVADFDHDVSSIEEALQGGTAPGDIEAGEACTILFRPSIGTSGVQMLRINRPTRTILGACHGHRTVAGIVADTEAALGATDLRDRVMEAIGRLLAAQVLSLDTDLVAHRPMQAGAFASATQTESM
jgi:hypothetical protein